MGMIMKQVRARLFQGSFWQFFLVIVLSIQCIKYLDRSRGHAAFWIFHEMSFKSNDS